MTIDLTPLDRFCYSDPPPLPGFTGQAAKAGRRGPVGFIYTVDHDGQIELSLARLGTFRPATDAMVKAFFRYLGVEPFREETGGGKVRPGIRHFVVVKGQMQ